MEDSKRKAAATTRAARVEKSRAQFRTLIAANPNYFGNFPGAKFKAVTKLLSNTSYEQLTELGYNPRMRRLTATFDIKKSAGYGGDLCADGTREYVRFYVNRGSGWEDAGLVAAEVHDIPAGKDCANRNTHPLSYSVEVAYSPRRKWCTSPQLPKARAILSWNAEPPAGQPNWKPVYGNVLECHIQIDKGLDFAGNKGDAIVATAAGVVSWAGKRYGYGQLVEIAHGNGYSTRYGHCHEILVKPGDRVEPGQTIALMGSSGRSTGPHVHYEVLQHGRQINPTKFVRASR